MITVFANVAMIKAIILGSLILAISLVSYFSILYRSPFVAIAAIAFMLLAGAVVLFLKSKYRTALYITFVVCIWFYFGVSGSAELMLQLLPVILYFILAAACFYSCRNSEIPVITRIAIAMKGVLLQEELVYTRKITFAWGIFFIFLSIESLLLGTLMPIAYWALFLNVINYLLIVLFFVIEHSVRIRVLRHLEHPSFFAFAKKLILLDYVTVFSKPPR